MDCDLETFMREILGKWGFTMADWVYLQSGYEREREIQKKMDLLDESDPNKGKSNIQRESQDMQKMICSNSFKILCEYGGK